MFDLKDKVAVVTGGTKGIGAAITEAMAKNGAHVVVVSRTSADCENVAAKLTEKYGVEAYPHSCDVSDSASIAQLVEDVTDKFGRIDILVNNAGVAVTKPAVDLTESDWDKVLNTNLKGPFFLSQAVAKKMIERGYGRVINIASMFGLVGDKNILPYLASKGGIVQMTKGLALEWAKYGVTVNAVAPGYVVTSINEKELNEEVVRKHILGKTPMRRYGNAEEIANVVLFLATEESAYVTGSVYSVDGGWTAQ